MRLMKLNSAAIADAYRVGGGFGSPLWHYRSLVADLDGDGAPEMVLVANSMARTFGAWPVPDPKTYLTVIALGGGAGTDVTASYLPGGSVAGWSRRTFARDLNGDGRQDFVFVMNREDGRLDVGPGGVFIKGSDNAVLLSGSGGYTVGRFSGDYWSHMAAIGDYDGDGLTDLVEGYFRDAAGQGGILRWEFDPASGSFVQSGTVAGVQASSAHMVGDWLVGNRVYPDLADIVAVNLVSGLVEPVLTRTPDYVTRTLTLWSGDVATMSLRQEGAFLVLENGIGETKPITVRGQAGFLAIQEDRDFYSLQPDGVSYRSLNRQDFHIYNATTRQIEQTLEAGFTEAIGYMNSFSVVDLNNDGNDDILFPNNKIYWSLPDGRIFISGFDLGARIADAEVKGILADNQTWTTLGAARIGGQLVLASVTAPFFGAPGAGYTPNYPLQFLGLDGFANDFGVVNAIELSFPIGDIIRHEAGLVGLELPGLHVGAQVYGMAADGMYRRVDVTPGGALAFVAGGAGDDLVAAQARDSVLLGGPGFDTALLEGVQADWRIGRLGDTVVMEGLGRRHTLLEMEAVSFGGGEAVALEALLALPGADPLMSVTRGGMGGFLLPARYEGPVAHLEYELLGDGRAEVVGGTAAADFLNLLGGDDAADGGAGDDVIDGGTGSNFLTGGAGRDVFFLDGRGGALTWATITDWEPGEQLAVWGWQPGVSTAVWVDNAGAPGWTGVTMHGDLNGDGVVDTSVTWTGRSRADLPAESVFDGLLWFV